MRVEQREDAGEVTELLKELHFLHKASVRLVLGLGRVDQLEGDDFPILIRRPPDSRVPADAELLVQRPGADRVAGGGHDVSLSGLSDAGGAASTGTHS